MLNLPELADSTYSGVGIKVIEKTEDAIVLAFRGKMIANTTEDIARRAVSLCAREGWAPEIILDFTQVGRIDSIGIGAICEIHSHAANHHARLAIRKASPSIQKVLRLMSVDSFIDLK